MHRTEGDVQQFVLIPEDTPIASFPLNRGVPIQIQCKFGDHQFLLGTSIIESLPLVAHKYLVRLVHDTKNCDLGEFLCDMECTFSRYHHGAFAGTDGDGGAGARWIGHAVVQICGAKGVPIHRLCYKEGEWALARFFYRVRWRLMQQNCGAVADVYIDVTKRGS